jgi:hypothetical protein
MVVLDEVLGKEARKKAYLSALADALQLHVRKKKNGTVHNPLQHERTAADAAAQARARQPRRWGRK